MMIRQTEMVIFCSKHHLEQYGHCTINIGDSAIIPVSHVRNLGVQMDDHLSMISQVTAICTACNFQLYSLSSDYLSFGLLQLIAPEPTDITNSTPAAYAEQGCKTGDSDLHARTYHTGAKITPLVANRQTYCV